MRTHVVRTGLTVGVCLALLGGCTPKSGTTTPPKPSPSPTFISRFGPTPAAALATLPVQPKSGTWEVVGKLASDKIKPFNVVLEFQPDGLIRVDGRLKMAEQAVNDAYNRDYVSRTASLGQEKTTVIFHIGGQYTLTVLTAELLDGVGLVGGRTPAAVRVTWKGAETVPAI
jgi:hypothetical protein